MKFLTEAEVAQLLRCSTSKIKRLRLGGGLPYLPGRPVLVEEAALRTFLAERTATAGNARAAAAGRPAQEAPSPEETARKRARASRLRRRFAGGQ